jgi:hypothetical protein
MNARMSGTLDSGGLEMKSLLAIELIAGRYWLCGHIARSDMPTVRLRLARPVRHQHHSVRGSLENPWRPLEATRGSDSKAADGSSQEALLLNDDFCPGESGRLGQRN